MKTFISIFLIIYFFNFQILQSMAQEPHIVQVVLKSADSLTELKQVLTQTNLQHLSIKLWPNQHQWVSFANNNSRRQLGLKNEVSFKLKVHLPTLPVGLGQLHQLETLELSWLGLKQLPAELANLQKLKYLNLSYNDNAIATELYKLYSLPQLQILRIYGVSMTEKQIQQLKIALPKTRILYTAEHLSADINKPQQEVQFPRIPSLYMPLYEAIQKYYFLANPEEQESFEGFLQCKALIAEKFKPIKHNKSLSTWKTMVSQLQEQLPELQVRDASFNQFPSYSLDVIFDEKQQQDLTVRTYLTASFSLLTKHYTVFFSKSYSFNEHASNLEKDQYQTIRNSPIKSLYFGEKNATDLEKEVFQLVKTSIKTVFPKYEFVSHQPLLSREVRGLPYGESHFSSERSYPIYNYLFGLGNYDKRDVID